MDWLSGAGGDAQHNITCTVRGVNLTVESDGWVHDECEQLDNYHE